MKPSTDTMLYMTTLPMGSPLLGECQSWRKGVLRSISARYPARRSANRIRLTEDTTMESEEAQTFSERGARGTRPGGYSTAMTPLRALAIGADHHDLVYAGGLADAWRRPH
jgi:hypothetical protein